ncbi:MAG: GxxExxY protein [Longimicrobiales bacterium]
MDEEQTATAVIDCALKIHRAIGPGMLESAYQAMLSFELADRGHDVAQQVYVGLNYRGLHLERAFCVDLIVDECVVVEIKSLEKLAPVHTRQILTYLRMTGHHLGLLINFGQETLKAGGIHRLANGYRCQQKNPSFPSP